MDRPSGIASVKVQRLWPIRQRLAAAVVGVLSVAVLWAGAAAAQTDAAAAPPAAHAGAKAGVKHGAKSKTSKSASKNAPKSPGAKGAKKAKAGKPAPGSAKGKKAVKKIPASAKAPALPRREPITLTAKDRDALSEAMKAAEQRAWPRALAAATRTGNPIVKRIIDWAYIREPGNHVTFADRTAFIANNPGWPGLKDIQRRAEEALDDPATVTVPTVLIGWFTDHPPLTAPGKVAYARALRTLGQQEQAITVARDAWRSGMFFDRTAEHDFLEAFVADLRPEDEQARLQAMLYEENTTGADRMLSRVDQDSVAIARVRIALITAAGNAETLLHNLPPALLDEPGIVYDRIKWRRHRDQEDAARALLPTTPDRGPRADLMWKERQILARDALADGLVSEAYTIVKNRGELDAATGLADAEWLEGWIDLRYLKDSEAALSHFEKVYDTVQVAANIARGAYWTGRTAEALGRGDVAHDWYKRAATYITTYYGQLALARLHDDPLPALSDDPVPSPEDRRNFEAEELTQAMRALADVGNTTYLRQFVVALAAASDNAVDRHMAAEFAERMGHPDWGVSIARQAGRENITLLTYGYPVPAYAIPAEPERAFVLSIARQESNFDPNAQSAAGAVGLMQLMPTTAKAVAKAASVKYVRNKLTSDPAYNLKLGSHYLNGLVDSFDGSYVLAAASYNAGPARARQWMRQFGDPRDGQTDPVDWVEQIPFSETRAYVQRVMENLMIYRARLAKTRAVGQTLESELSRPGKPPGANRG